MAIPAGIAGQLGFKSESTWGTPVTVDQFACGFMPTDSVEQDIDRYDSDGIKAGREGIHAWQPGAIVVGGSIELELWTEPLATLLTHMFGDVQTTGSGPYTHTATFADLTGKSLTLQIGRPDAGGTVRPFTYSGVKIGSWTLEAAVGEIPKLTLEVTAKDEDTGTGLATASYPSGAVMFAFVDAKLEAGGAQVATVESFTLTVDNNLKTDRHKLDDALVLEQLQNGRRSVEGSFVAEFEDLTEYNRYVNGDEYELVLTFDNGTESLVITLNVRSDGNTPVLSTEGILPLNVDFVGVSATSDADLITAVLINSESSAA